MTPAEIRELIARRTRISPEIKREDRDDGTERYIVSGVPCGFPVATFGDFHDARFFVEAATALTELLARVEEMERQRSEIGGILVCMIEAVKSTAEKMPAPNDWTPQFMMIATSAEFFMNRARAKLSGGE